MEADKTITEESVPATSALRKRIYLLSGLVLGAIFLSITLRSVDLEAATAAFLSVKLAWVLPMMACFVFELFMRTWRWMVMFPVEGRPSFRTTFNAFIIGRVGNTLMPGRLGDILRAGVIGRQCPAVGISGSLATIVLERAFDVLILLLLVVIAVLYAPLPGWVVKAGGVLLVAVSAVLIGLWVLDRLGERDEGKAFVDSLGGMPGKVARRLLELLQKFSTGLHTLRSPRQFMTVGMLTAVIWATDVLVVYLCMLAFSITAPYMAAIVAVVFFCVGSIMPAAPGFIGTYQLFIVSALALYGVSEDISFAMSLFLNLFIILGNLLFGVLVLISSRGLLGLNRKILASSNQ